ncbi:glucose-6-phosphate exchanger SLC37A4-like [Lineus longissimus]|uniref:glucose-6-phosphate exchanger SLC37A4-like n=1 Tax=Lineus longissimus TaxID=88925 RepID=UPI002B4E1A93
MSWTIRQYQMSVFLSMYVGYLGYNLNRRSLSYIMPAFMKAEGLDKSDLGLISSSLMIAYAISKLIGGVLSDQINPKLLFISGLMLSGFATFIFPYGGVLPMYCALQFLNGFAQGVSWPSCAKLLRKWYAPSQLATWWGILSSSSNLGGSVAPIIVSYMIQHMGWVSSVQSLGCLTVVLPLVFIFTMWGSPKDVGLTDFPTGHEDIGPVDSGEDSQNDKKAPTKPSETGTIVWLDLLKNPYLLLLTAGYMLAGLIRASCNDWGQLLLMQQYGHTQYMASAFNSSFEAGGLTASFVTGYIADRLMKSRKSDVGSPRMLVVIGSLLITGVFLFLLGFFTSSESNYVFVTFVSFMIGGGVFSLVTLYGVMSTEASPPELSGTAHAIAALGANSGYVLGGYPVTLIAKYIDWTGVFIMLSVATLAMMIITALLRDLQSPVRARSMDKKTN